LQGASFLTNRQQADSLPIPFWQSAWCFSPELTFANLPLELDNFPTH
jgi:hypothetical protein